MRTWLAYLSWQIPGLRRYCFQCDRCTWAWNRCHCPPCRSHT